MRSMTGGGVAAGTIVALMQRKQMPSRRDRLASSNRRQYQGFRYVRNIAKLENDVDESSRAGARGRTMPTIQLGM